METAGGYRFLPSTPAQFTHGHAHEDTHTCCLAVLLTLEWFPACLCPKVNQKQASLFVFM